MTARPGLDLPGLDLPALARWLDEQHPGTRHGEQVGERIVGGKSNLTYRVSDGETTWAVRRPPLGHVLPTAHDMAREFRVIRGADRHAGWAARGRPERRRGLTNVIYAHPLDRIAAIVDWEMATIGDPLADLGLLRVYHHVGAGFGGVGEVVPGLLDAALETLRN